MDKLKIPTWIKIVSVVIAILVLYLIIPKWTRLYCEFDNRKKIIHYNAVCLPEEEESKKYPSLRGCKNVYPCHGKLFCLQPMVVPPSCGIGCRINKDSGEIKCLLVVR